MPFSPTTSDVELTQLARKGNPDAITCLVERFSQPLFHYLCSITRDQSNAEDLLQETWLRAMEHLDRFDPARSFKTWLFAIGHHCAIDAFRSQKRWGPPSGSAGFDDADFQDGLERLADESPSALSQLSQQEIETMTARIFSRLPLHYREVLTLRFHEELPIAEIARVLDLPLSTVKTRIKRGLEFLRSKMSAMER